MASFNENFKTDTLILHITGWTCLNITDFYKWSQAVTNFKNISPSSTLEIITPAYPGKQAGLGKGAMRNYKIETHIHDGTGISSQALLVNEVKKKERFFF